MRAEIIFPFVPPAQSSSSSPKFLRGVNPRAQEFDMETHIRRRASFLLCQRDHVGAAKLSLLLNQRKIYIATYKNMILTSGSCFHDDCAAIFFMLTAVFQSRQIYFYNRHVSS